MSALSSRASGFRRIALQPLKMKQRPTGRTAMVVRAAGLTPQYGYVVASVAVTAGILQYLGFKVGFARRTYGVKHPKMYADGDDENAIKFNCIQRAHQNALEMAPSNLAMVVLLGLQYPVYAAVLNTVWNISRLIYAMGYSTGNPSKRVPGFALCFFTHVAVIISTLVTGLKMANILPA